MLGRVFGNLTVLRLNGKGPRGCSWVCLCTCGKEVKRTTGQLEKEGYRSCGCGQQTRIGVVSGSKELRLANKLTHKSWAGMIARCFPTRYKSKTSCYASIAICDRWLVFENFLNDMGPRPSVEYSIDREDANSDYCKENCSWVTKHHNCSKIRLNLTPERNQKVSDGIVRAWAEGRMVLTAEARAGIGRGGEVRRGRKLQSCERCGAKSYRSICQQCIIKQKRKQNDKRRELSGLPPIKR